MIIENPDAFKSWLTSILEPLCDADPAALAKYVYALVKKDKPIEELRDGMVDQLDVFLQHETKPFVDMLFKSLESQDYLAAAEKLMAEKPVVPEPPQETTQEPLVEPEPEKPAANGTSSPPSGGAIRGRSPPPGSAPAITRHRVVVSRAPHKAVAAPAGAPAAPPPPMSRAPPLEQTLVKVLPLTELLEEPVDQPPRRRDRREMMRDDRRRRRSRSWERRARARRHRDGRDGVRDARDALREARDIEHLDRPYDKRRAISRSPSPRGRYRNRSPPPVVIDRPPSRSRSRSPVPIRDRDHERERMRLPRELERDRMSRDREHRDRLSRSRDRDRSRDRSRSLSPHPDERPNHAEYNKRRCRDFDEKGYCMRGDLCQWDHGTDPVVLEDAALTRVLTIPPPVPEYNPLAPDIWCGPAPFAPFPPPHPHPHPHPRELVPIPSIPQPIIQPFGLVPRLRHDVPPPGPPGMMPLPPRHPPPPKKNFDYNRLGPARPPPLPAGAVNCSLEVKKVPRGLNDITHLNNHFSKFGKIVNIQVCYDSDPEAALITFSNPTEANVAYKSTEAVLNNRFIKVFWHNPDHKQENVAPSGQQNNKPAEQRQNNNYPMSHNKVLINRDNIKATADIKQQLQQQQMAEKLKETTANGPAEPTKPTPAPIEKSKQIMEMHKRAQALLETQLQQQVLLIQKLESGNVTGPQKAALLEAINSAQEGIEKLRKELVAYNKTLRQMQVNAKKPKTREEAQKEILDAELDMFTKQQEGQDVSDLQKKIADLRRLMAVQFPTHASRRPHNSAIFARGGGRFNTATRFTRGAAPSKVFNNQSVDHRPRALLVSGFEADELDALVAHFAQFGEITHKESNMAVPELIVVFKARAHAEQAAHTGKQFNDRTLSITWVTNAKALSGIGGSSATPAVAAHPAQENKINGDDTAPETPTELNEDALLRFDEEEDEDAEDRSWRR